MASVASPILFVLTNAQAIAAGCSIRTLEPYVKKDGTVYSLVGATPGIRELANRCGALFKLSEAELWENVGQHREDFENGRNKDIVRAAFSKRVGDCSRESIYWTCLVLQSCINLEPREDSKKLLQSQLDSITPFLR